MRPPGSLAIKVCIPLFFFPFSLSLLLVIVTFPLQDYAIETPLEKLSEGDSFHEVTINLNLESSVAVLNFVLKVLFASHFAFAFYMYINL